MENKTKILTYILFIFLIIFWSFFIYYSSSEVLIKGLKEFLFVLTGVIIFLNISKILKFFKYLFKI